MWPAALRQGLGEVELVGLGRGDEGGLADGRVGAVGQVAGDCQAAEAMGDGQPVALLVRCPSNLQRTLDALGPALQLRPARVALRDAAGVAVLALRPGLSMRRAAVVQARDDKESRRLVGNETSRLWFARGPG